MSPQLDALFLRAYDSASTSLSLSDVDGRLIGGNQAFWKLFGHEPGTDLTTAALTRRDDRTWTSGYLRQLIDGDIEEFKSDKRFVRADGSEFDGHISIRALRDDDVCVGMIASIEPVTIRPRIDDIRTRKLLEHAAGTLTLIDVDGQVLETSGRYRSTLGYPMEFWEQRTILDVLVPEDAARVLAMRDDVINEPNREITGDFRVTAADRQIETLEVTATNLLHDPDVEGIVITSRNVTEERANTRAVSELRDAAVAQAERRSNLLATVSHELRNPLHAMAGIAELLASDTGLTTAQHDLARALERQLLRLSDVTDDLLDAARLDVGQFRLRPAAFDIRHVVDDVVRSARSTADGRLTVDATIGDDVPLTINADAARLQQVVGNLVGNAVKFTEAGSVRVAVRRRQDTLVVSVTDTGPGIPSDRLEEVFHAFATLPSAGDRRGAGLGLAIVRRLVEAMDGSIDLDSTVGVGTTFAVSLPLIEGPDEPGRSDDSDPVDGVGGVRRRVLVIEDTPVNQDLARAQLDRLGVDCVIAGSAEDGLDELSRTHYDAVLMDHQLPGMSGREATREIRRRGWTVPVVGVTASSTAADERACMDAGMDAFLSKPVGLDRLRGALDTVAPIEISTSDVSTSTVASTHEPTGPAGPRSSVDVATLEVLVEELGDRTIVEQLIGSFLAELDARSADIGGDDESLAARQAHTLKSSAALLGVDELAAACAAAQSDPTVGARIASLAADVRADLLAWSENQER